jgi:T-complex protein 1 subunit alpha
MRRIARATGAHILTTLANDDGTESFDEENVGYAETVYEDTVGDMDYLFIEGMQNATCCTLLLRGPNDFMLDEVERSIHDSLCVMKRTLESGYIVPGGGSVEVALSLNLENFAKSLGTKE